MMRWAIALALEGAGRTSPNPMVGAIVVKGGRIVGEGYHRRAGTPHAEVHALRGAGKKARGADLYVTLEPCCHTGRTPPCTEAIIEAGISQVFVGARDPNPKVNGRGVRALRNAGIHVTEGVLEASCGEINRAYNRFITTGMPFVTAKAALTIDGKIGTAGGDSRWITNAACRRYVHELRSNVDAIMIGGGTIRMDDPRLTVRLSGWHGIQPRILIVDAKLDIPRYSNIMSRPAGSLIFATTNQAPLSRIKWINERGHRVIVCRATKDGRVFLPQAMREIAKQGIGSVLLEGGGHLFADAISRGLVQRLVACIAPKLLGGGSRDFLPGLSVRAMKDAIELEGASVKTFGDNVVVEGTLSAIAGKARRT